MKIFITGASGFVGQNLKQYLLNQKNEIIPISLRNDSWRNDLKAEGDVLIHLAGKAHDTDSKSEDREYFLVNADLTINLFNEFLKSNIRDFFYFSSVKAVADVVDGILTEDAICIPATAYGKSKLRAEQFLLGCSLPSGKRLFIIRPCMIHGPGNKGNLNLLYKVVEKGIPWPLASFSNQRSFLSIDNLCFLIHSMLENPLISSGVYNFADDEVLSTNDLVLLISDTVGKKGKLWNIPGSLIKSLVKVGDIIPLPLNSERLKKLTESYIVSNRKIKEALGIQKLPVGTKEGLIKTIASFL